MKCSVRVIYSYEKYSKSRISFYPAGSCKDSLLCIDIIIECSKYDSHSSWLFFYITNEPYRKIANL